MEMISIFLNKLLREAAQRRASSVYLTVGSLPVFRIDNKLIGLDSEEIITRERNKKIVNTFLEEGEIEKLKKDKQLIVVKNFFNDLRFRVNITYQKGFMNLSLHYISDNIMPFDELGFESSVKEMLNYQSGLLLVTGPANSGKTSTISSVIQYMNDNQKKYIVTIESVIERLFTNKKSIIIQREFGRDFNSYKDVLYNCLEDDIDAVYIGENNKFTKEYLPFALELAAGNCLVILEIGGRDVVRGLEKIIDLMQSSRSKESASHMLADLLIAGISQKLIPNKQGSISLAKEVLLNNPSIKSLIRDNKISQVKNIMQNFKEEGTISMERSVRDLINKGEVDKESVDDLNLQLDY